MSGEKGRRCGHRKTVGESAGAICELEAGHRGGHGGFDVHNHWIRWRFSTADRPCALENSHSGVWISMPAGGYKTCGDVNGRFACNRPTGHAGPHALEDKGSGGIKLWSRSFEETTGKLAAEARLEALEARSEMEESTSLHKDSVIRLAAAVEKLAACVGRRWVEEPELLQGGDPKSKPEAPGRLKRKVLPELTPREEQVLQERFGKPAQAEPEDWLAQLEFVEARATLGPWDGTVSSTRVRYFGASSDVLDYGDSIAVTIGPTEEASANATFIAEARNAFPRLLKALRAADALVAEIEECMTRRCLDDLQPATLDNYKKARKGE